jgi:hypothetical protein
MPLSLMAQAFMSITYRTANISFKSDVGSYTYGENNTGPHALTSISGAKSNTFTYDVNGNQLASLYRQVTYSSSNRPVTITKAG